MHFFSQVLSLNLTNLLIIALLKILVFAAGIIGANHFKHGGYGGRHQEPSHYGEYCCYFGVIAFSELSAQLENDVQVIDGMCERFKVFFRIFEKYFNL